MNEPINNGLQNGAPQSNEPINNNPQMQAPQMSEPTNNGSQPTKNTKNKKIFIGLFVAIVLIVVALFTCIAMLATPKKVFETAIEKVFNSVDKTNPDKIKTVNGNLSLDVNITGEDSNEIYDLINDIDLKLGYGFDYENKKMNVNLDTTYQKEELLNVDLATKNDIAYIYLEDVFDKYIETPIDGFSEIFESQDMMNEANTIIDEVEKAIKESLKDEYFSSEDAKITLNGKEVKVTKNILTLNSKNSEKLIKDIAKKLNNDKFVKSVAKLTEEDESTIKEGLKSVQDEKFEMEEEITISIYTKGMMKEAVGFEAKEAENTITILEDTKDNYKFTIKSSDEKIEGNVKITEKNDNVEMDLTIKVEDTKVNIKMTSSYEYNKKVKDINVSNSVAIDELTTEDQNEITMNLLSNEKIMEIVEIFSTQFGALSGSSNTSYDYDYENDYNYDYEDYDYSTDYSY